VGRTVLVVEDDRELSATLAEVLRDYEYNVECAHDGAAALDRLQRTTPSVIVLDLRMPGMNGIEFLARRQTDDALARIPVIVLSADVEMSHRARELDANAVLHKPVHLFLLVDAIQRSTQRGSSAGSEMHV
jgi:two-component system, chemotaxis family, chemotaxis protein CheY